MAHKVICSICKEQFDRDKIPAIKTSVARYAHAQCALEHGTKEQQALAEKALADQSQESKDLTILENYIIELLALDYITPRIRKQINDFHNEKEYTYTGMLKTLKYFYEVRGNSTEKANGGIGIIPFIYDDANKYYFQIWAAQQVNEVKPIEQYQAPPERVIVMKPPEPTLRTRRKLFTFLDEEDENGI